MSSEITSVGSTEYRDTEEEYDMFIEADPRTTLIDLLRNSHLCLGTPIGSGKGGVVSPLYFVKDALVKDTQKVIKVAHETISPAMYPQFNPLIGEHLATPLNHPNLIGPEKCYYNNNGLITCQPSSRSLFVGQIMRKSKGVPLSTYLEKRQPNLRERVKILYDISRALAYLHAQRMIHGDLNFNNILVEGEGVFLKGILIDFGLAHKLPDNPKDPKSETPKDQGSLFDQGMTCFLAPEILQNSPHQTNSDVWALGKICSIIFHNDRQEERRQNPTHPICKHKEDSTGAVNQSEPQPSNPVSNDEEYTDIPCRPTDTFALNKKPESHNEKWLLNRIEALIGRMLDPNPKTRISIYEVVKEFRACL